MIDISISWAVCIYVTSVLCLVFILWIFYNYQEEQDSQQTAYLLQCTFCGHLFFNYKNADILTCPLCRSYIATDKEIKTPTLNNENIKPNQ